MHWVRLHDLHAQVIFMISTCAKFAYFFHRRIYDQLLKEFYTKSLQGAGLWVAIDSQWILHIFLLHCHSSLSNIHFTIHTNKQLRVTASYTVRHATNREWLISLSPNEQKQLWMWVMPASWLIQKQNCFKARSSGKVYGCIHTQTFVYTNTFLID